VPTCPEWTVNDLVRHIGHVHRWAAAHVRDQRPTPLDSSEQPDVIGPAPSDADLLAWYRDGHRALVTVLAEADPAVECWSFLPAPSPLAFWARRQCHETTIHRADAESATGGIGAIDPVVAGDGIDELLGGFLARPRHRDVGEPLTLHLVASDTGRSWTAVLGPDAVELAPAHVPAGPSATVRAPVSDLELLLWNRRPAGELDVDGDASVLETWGRLVQVRWS
jgi:uncharacterized protein (TIGR03083 family)